MSVKFIEVITYYCCEVTGEPGTFIALERISVDKFVGDNRGFARATTAAADKIGESLCTLCVIVRPNYNETDDQGRRFFREWRSFNGSTLEEVRWYFHKHSPERLAAIHQRPDWVDRMIITVRLTPDNDSHNSPDAPPVRFHIHNTKIEIELEGEARILEFDKEELLRALNVK